MTGPIITPGTPTHLYKAISLDELETLPDPVWLVSHWAMRQSITFLTGRSETFKTFLAMDLVYKAADPFFDKFGPHSIDRTSATDFGGGLKALYVIGESQGAAKFRFKAISQYHKRPYPRGLRVHPSRVDMYGQAAEVLDLVDSEDPDIVVFDTLSRNTYGMNENDKQDVDKAMKIAHELKMGGSRGGRSVIFIHHPPSADGAKSFRGHTSLLNDSDIMIKTERHDPEKKNPIAPFYTNVKSERQKETDDFREYWAKLITHNILDASGKPIPKWDGGFVSSLVIENTTETPVAIAKAPKSEEVLEYIMSNPTASANDIQMAIYGKKGTHAYDIIKRLPVRNNNGTWEVVPEITGNSKDGFYVIEPVKDTLEDL